MLDVGHLFFLQFTAIGAAVLAGIRFPDLGREVENRWARVADRVSPALAPVAIALLALAGCIAVALLVRFPLPWVHDEFSYLLAGDTFAAGRLTNPTHQFWPFFDTFHVIQQPTYASKYPPGQGVLLALGQVIGGHPAAGVWLGIALACGAICWMLQAFVSHRWAVLGGLLAVVNFSFFSFWAHSYVVHALSAAGGAMLVGGVRRLASKPNFVAGLTVGAGLVILGVSRPFEGLVLAVPWGAALTWAIWTAAPAARAALVRASAAILLVLAAGATAQGVYNQAVTGSYSRMPYAEHEEQYAAAPVYLWAEAPPIPEYSDPALESYQVGWNRVHYQIKRSAAGWLLGKTREMLEAGGLLLQFSLWVPIFAFLSQRRRRDGWENLLALSTGLVLLSVLGLTWSTARMLAPVAGPLILMAVLGLQWIREWQPEGTPVGRVVSRGIVLATCLSLLAGLIPWFQEPIKPVALERARVMAELREAGERHLVIVTYGPNHNIHQEWVYNRADIDGAAIVWARDKGPAANRRLLDYFDDRQVWRLEDDGPPVRLVPYDSGTATGAGGLSMP
ncbi:MAG: hypothetical protein M8872_05895 [marine benthic group bacterium]|nr:hypothetical protein [Gemmatimonadota bacterium]